VLTESHSRRSVWLSLLLGQRVPKHRELLPRVLRGRRSRQRVLRRVSSTSPLDRARARAAHVWNQRRITELEAAERFAILAVELASQGASEPIVAMTREASGDERRHAELCLELADHFGAANRMTPSIIVRRVSPADLEERERLLYEVVALSCVTETLSTALLGALVEQARDDFAKQTMRSILRDEVQHSKLGWAFLAEEHARGARDCVGRYLPRMLEATLGEEPFSENVPATPEEELLAGLGSLQRRVSGRVAREALELVIFPGLERFGIDATLGRSWLTERVSASQRT